MSRKQRRPLVQRSPQLLRPAPQGAGDCRRHGCRRPARKRQSPARHRYRLAASIQLPATASSHYGRGGAVPSRNHLARHARCRPRYSRCPNPGNRKPRVPVGHGPSAQELPPCWFWPRTGPGKNRPARLPAGAAVPPQCYHLQCCAHAPAVSKGIGDDVGDSLALAGAGRTNQDETLAASRHGDRAQLRTVCLQWAD